MYRRVFALLCALALLCAAALAEEPLTQPSCTHSFAPEGVLLHKCVLCGEMANHTLSPVVVLPTCASVGYTMDVCTVCGYEGPQYAVQPSSASAHDWGEWTVLAESTCTQPGRRERSCRQCGAVQEAQAPLAEHKWVSTTVLPTCTSDGYTQETCSVCGEAKPKGDVVPRSAAYHDWSAFAEVLAPTCTAPGAQERECRICGAKHRQVVDMLPHTRKTLVVQPGCEGGYTVDVCEKCGAELSARTDRTEPVHAFTQWETLTLPTCEAEGTSVRTCTLCGETETQPLPPTGHVLSVEVTEPTCREDGYSVEKCSLCGYESEPFAIVRAHSRFHRWDEDRWERTLEPTCTEWGLYYQACEICGKMREVPVQPRGHEGVEQVFAATFTQDGYTATVCTVCGSEYGARREHVPAGMYSAPMQELQLDDAPIAGIESAVLCTAVSEDGETAAIVRARGDFSGIVELDFADPFFAENAVAAVEIALPGAEISLVPEMGQVHLESTAMGEGGERLVSILCSLPIDGFSEEMGSYAHGVYTAYTEEPVTLRGRWFTVAIEKAPATIVLATTVQDE